MEKFRGIFLTHTVQYLAVQSVLSLQFFLTVAIFAFLQRQPISTAELLQR